MVGCKECRKRGINVRTGEPLKRCPKRVEVILDFGNKTCVELYQGVVNILPSIQKDKLTIKLIDKERIITVLCHVEETSMELNKTGAI